MLVMWVAVESADRPGLVVASCQSEFRLDFDEARLCERDLSIVA